MVRIFTLNIVVYTADMQGKGLNHNITLCQAGATIMDLDKADMERVLAAAEYTDAEKEVIIDFLLKCNRIKHEGHYYLIFELGSDPYCPDRRYLKLTPERLPIFQKVVENYEKIKLQPLVQVGYRTIRSIGIEKRTNSGLPEMTMGYGTQEASREELDLLLSIPSKPSFKTIESWKVMKLKHATEFHAPEKEMQALFDEKLSMEKTNYLCYNTSLLTVDVHMSLEAGRGDKWYLKSSSSIKELRDLIIKNTGPKSHPGSEDKTKFGYALDESS
jgi:hypothetical protein